MKHILIILLSIVSVTVYSQSPRIKLNQIVKDNAKGSILISSPTDSQMVYSRDFFINFGADTTLVLFGDTIGGGISTVVTDLVTIQGDGSVATPLYVDTSVINTIKGMVDTLTARGYLTTEVDGSTTNEIQTLSKVGQTVSLSLSGGSFTDDVLTETEVDAFVANNGYLTAEVDGSVTNEIQDISTNGNAGNISISSGSTLNLNVNDADASATNELQTISKVGQDITLSNGGGTVRDSILTESQVDAYVSDNGYITSEVDGNISNEGLLTVGYGSSISVPISSNTSGSNAVNIEAGTNITLLGNPSTNTITIGASGGGTSYNNISETADTVFISGDLNVDANTLRVDATTNKVGIGTSTPEAKLSVVGNISLDSGNSNFVIGKNAGESLTSGSSNTAIGSNALQYTATANNNFAIGSKALQNNTIGYGNIAIGTNALRDNTEGANNFAIGTNALLFNETASSNLAIGNSALVYFNSGNLNTAIGNNAGQYLADGSQLTTASNSVYVGYFTKASANSVTNENVFGYSATGNGSNSVTLGNSSITKTILNGNVGIGTSSPSGTLEVNKNVNDNNWIKAINTNIGTSARTGFVMGNGGTSADEVYFQLLGQNFNILGAGFNDKFFVSAGSNISNGIEFFANSGGIRLNASVFGADDFFIEDATGHIGVNNLSPNVELDVIGSIEYTGTITDVSDERLKINKEPLFNITSQLMRLNPIKYNQLVLEDNTLGVPEYGLTAQNVREVFPEMVTTVHQKDGVDYLGLSYIQLISPLIKGFQEQQAIIEAQATEIDQLKTLITDLTNRIQILENK